eukprot:scaffold3710_cov103-Cylindrotheca_fusiformis.AAC.5
MNNPPVAGKKTAESIPRSWFMREQSSEARMMVPRQSSVENVSFPKLKRWFRNNHPLRIEEGCRKYSEVMVCDRAAFRSSNDGSATIIR